MRKLLLPLVTFLLAASAAADPYTYTGNSDSRSRALGVVFGEPTGLSGKYWLNNRNAIDAGLAYSFDRYMLVFADYLVHFPGLLGRRDKFIAELWPYAGVGAIFFLSTLSDRDSKNRFVNNSASSGIGVRVPLGIEWRPPAAPLGVFVELVPGIGIIPNTTGFIDGGIGIRYYFD